MKISNILSLSLVFFPIVACSDSLPDLGAKRSPKSVVEPEVAAAPVPEGIPSLTKTSRTEVVHTMGVEKTPQATEDRALYARVKNIIQALDVRNQQSVPFPFKRMEGAMRHCFLMLADGKPLTAWMGNRTEEMDRSVALANVELLVNYTNALLDLTHGKKKLKLEDLPQMRLLAAKNVIDAYNKQMGDTVLNRTPSSMTNPQGLSRTGRVEWARRSRLLGNMAMGKDYEPIRVQNLEDFPKKLRTRLQSSAGEYDEFAELLLRAPAPQKAKKPAKHRKS